MNQRQRHEIGDRVDERAILILILSQRARLTPRIAFVLVREVDVASVRNCISKFTDDRSEMASTSDDVLHRCACASTVAGAKAQGEAIMRATTLSWQPLDDDNFTGAKVVRLLAVTAHQRNKPGSATASLRLVPENDAKRALVLAFSSESDRDALSDAIKMQIKKLEEEARGAPTAAELAARKELLKKNVEIAQLYEETVKTGVISDEDFWEARRNLFTDVVARRATGQKIGIENTLDGDLKGARDGMSDTVTCNLTNEKMHRIFAERPSVRQAFLDNVPKKMTEREFWTRFLRSEYFKQMRAGAPPQGEEEAADLALFSRKPLDADTRKAQIKTITPTLNLKAEEDEALGDGYGLLRDGSRDRRRPKEAGPLPEVFAELNHHAAVVLRGQPQANIVDARSAAIAARDHEQSAEGAKIGVEESNYLIDDLVAPPPPASMKELNISDSHQYFSSIVDDMAAKRTSKSSKAVIEPFKAAVTSALNALTHPEKRHKCAMEPVVASEVLTEVTKSLAKVEDLNAQFASHQSFSSAEDSEPIPSSVDVQLSRSALTGGELLRQFWMSTPMVTSVRWEKATKVSKSIETLYDTLEKLKGSLAPVHRHITSQRLRPLLSAFDSALTFYDDEKTRRPQAFADFEKAQAQVA